MGHPSPSSSSKVFVCYSRRDRSAVDRIVAGLEASGHAFWIDRADIVSSEVWRGKIANAVEGCDALMFFASEQSLASPQVDAEITLAKEFGKPIVPVFLSSLQPTGAIAYSIAGLHRIYYRGEGSLEEIDLALRTLKQPGAAGGRVAMSGRKPPSRAVLWGVLACLLVACGGLAAWKLSRPGKEEPGRLPGTGLAKKVEPDRQPEPTPVPEPRPTPKPAPLPEPRPAPAPAPVPEPRPAPAPEPVPPPAPEPTPTPEPPGPGTDATPPGTVRPLDPGRFEITPPGQDP